MNNIKKFLISPSLIEVIKDQARSSYDEIYGWLIGYSKNNIPHILALSECKRFEQQTLVSAIPNALEFQDLSSIMPQGIGPIGIYHSHPASSSIFHSHTDDNTLISLTSQFQNCVSIVTNGEEINFYQMGKEKKAKEIQAEFSEPNVSEFILFVIDEDFDISVSKNLLKEPSKANYIKMKIQNMLIDNFQKHWKQIDLSKKNLNIKEKTKVNKFLTNSLEKEPIYIEFPQITKQIINNSLILKDNDENNSILDENGYKVLNINLKTKFLIYVIDYNRELHAFKNVIRVEFLGNILPQKLHSSVLDLESSKLNIPEDYFLNFFGFFIRMLNFKDKNLNELTVSKSNYEFLSKVLSSFDYFANINVSKRIRAQITKFLSDLESFSKDYNWGDNFMKRIKLLRMVFVQ